MPSNGLSRCNLLSRAVIALNGSLFDLLSYRQLSSKPYNQASWLREEMTEIWTTKELDQIEGKREHSILLLGQSGVGK